jgi:beta-galactosidase
VQTSSRWLRAALALVLLAAFASTSALAQNAPSVPTTFSNDTNGAFPDDQVYVTVIGKDLSTGAFGWIGPDGQLTPMTAGDNDAGGHLTKNGENYPAKGFTLAQAKQLNLPKAAGGRIFISYGEPVYLKVVVGADGAIGFAGPNPANPSDANNDVKLDWYEFTYNDSGLWINTTQVDQFGFPLTLDVAGDGGFHKRVGIEQSRQAILDAYQAEVPDAFRGQADSTRIRAPAKTAFDAGQPFGTYYDDYINTVWADYATRDLVVDLWGGSRRFVGRTQGDGTLLFTEADLGNGAYKGGTYPIRKPTTQEVFEAKGAMAEGNDEQKALEAQVSAALNRHIAQDVSQWGNPAAWYQADPANHYAKFWHDHSIDGLAYGFSYDDVSEQSSTVNTGNPTQITLGLRW